MPAKTALNKWYLQAILEVSADTALHCTKTAIWAIGNQLAFMMVAASCGHVLTICYLPCQLPQECQWWSWQRRSQNTPLSCSCYFFLQEVSWQGSCTLWHPLPAFYPLAILPSCSTPTCPQNLANLTTLHTACLWHPPAWITHAPSHTPFLGLLSLPTSSSNLCDPGVTTGTSNSIAK